jgi:hypothetical protein
MIGDWIIVNEDCGLGKNSQSTIAELYKSCRDFIDSGFKKLHSYLKGV